MHHPHKEETFEMMLTAGMENFPERLGFVFRRHEEKTVCEDAFESIGTDKVMPIVC